MANSESEGPIGKIFLCFRTFSIVSMFAVLATPILIAAAPTAGTVACDGSKMDLRHGMR